MTSKLSGSPSERKKANGGSYYVQNYVDGEGKRKQASGATSLEAKSNAEAKIAGTHRKKVRSPETVTFEKFAKRFMEDSKAGRDGRLPMAPTTAKSYYGCLRRTVNPKIGHLRMSSIDRKHISKLRDELVAESCARSTALKSLTVTQAIMSYAVDCGVIPFSPAARIHIAGDWAEQEDSKEERVPTLAHMRQIEETAKECYHSTTKVISRPYRRYYPFFLLLRTLGLRSGECIGLQWGDFDSDMGKVSIRRTISSPQKGLSEADRVRRPKTKHGRRTIPVPRQIVPVLKTWREECPDTKEGWVFPTRSGNPVSYDNVRNKFWYPLMRRAGLEEEGYGMHGLRHYFASTLVSKGKVKEAQTYLGHHSAAFTMDQYGHLFPDDDKTMDAVRDTVMGDMSV